MKVTIPHQVVEMPYTTIIQLVESAPGAGAIYTFRINDLFDPDFTSAGQQPLGFDQFAQFYYRYRVLRFRYSIDYQNLTGTSNPVLVGVFFSPNSTAPVNPLAWSVQPTPGTKSTPMSAIHGGRDVVRLQGQVRISDVLGVTKEEYMSDMDYTGTTSSSVPHVS